VQVGHFALFCATQHYFEEVGACLIDLHRSELVMEFAA